MGKRLHIASCTVYRREQLRARSGSVCHCGVLARICMAYTRNAFSTRVHAGSSARLVDGPLHGVGQVVLHLTDPPLLVAGVQEPLPVPCTKYSSIRAPESAANDLSRARSRQAAGCGGLLRKRACRASVVDLPRATHWSAPLSAITARQLCCRSAVRKGVTTQEAGAKMCGADAPAGQRSRGW